MNTHWNGRRVLVTGINGFLATNLADKLLSFGAKVVGLERDVAQPNALDLFGIRESVSIVNGSVDDLLLMERTLNEFEVEAVFHLAAQAIVSSANRSPVGTFEANIRGTYVLLEACRRSSGVSAVAVASSDKAYGSHEELPYKEDFAMQGTFPYDVSKSCTDLIARSFAKTYHLPVTVARSANIYGPGDVNMTRIIPGTILSVLNGEQPIIRSDGTPVREYIHVSDVVDGYLRLLEEIESTKAEAFNLGSGDHVDVLTLVNTIIELCGASERIEPKVLLDRKIEREIDQQYLSSEKIRESIGWSARHDLRSGLANTIEWYRAKRDVLA